MQGGVQGSSLGVPAAPGRLSNLGASAPSGQAAFAVRTGSERSTQSSAAGSVRHPPGAQSGAPGGGANVAMNPSGGFVSYTSGQGHPPTPSGYVPKMTGF